MKKVVALLLAIAMCAALVACAKPAETKPAGSTGAAEYEWKGSRMTIGGADSTGTMYAAAAAIATTFTNKVKGLQVEASTSTGSNENALKVQSGEIELGMCSGDAAYNAINGKGKFDGNACKDLRCIGCVYSSMLSLIALKSSGWTYLHDVAGQKGTIGTGPAASTTEVGALLGLEKAGVVADAGLTFTNMTLGEAADGVKDGTALVGAAFAGVPVGAQLSAAAEKECVWLGFTDEELNEILKVNPVYAKVQILPNTYTSSKTTQDKAVNTFGVKCMVICKADMDKDLVYNLAKTLYEQADDMAAGNKFFQEMTDKAYIANDTPIALHDGAAQFYKEAGIIK